jgi:DNA repair exonuclease SbcCD ATPase subunit
MVGGEIEMNKPTMAQLDAAMNTAFFAREIAALRHEYDVACRARDELQRKLTLRDSEYVSVWNSRSTLYGKVDALETERDTLRAEVEEQTKRGDYFVRTRDETLNKLAAEQEARRQERASYVAQLDELQANRDALAAERDNIRNAYEGFRAAYDTAVSLAADADKLRAERDELRADRDSLRKDVNILRGKLSQVQPPPQAFEVGVTLNPPVPAFQPPPDSLSVPDPDADDALPVDLPELLSELRTAFERQAVMQSIQSKALALAALLYYENARDPSRDVVNIARDLMGILDPSAG